MYFFGILASKCVPVLHVVYLEAPVNLSTNQDFYFP